MNETKALQPGVRLQSKERTYEIVKVLGVGTFGITYLATTTILIGNVVTIIKFAIKEYFLSDSSCRGDDGISVHALPEAKSTFASSRVDFINEANRLKKICHKSRNIVSVNESFEANGTAYYVMEYLDGGNPSKCQENEAISIVMQIADALEVIHNNGIIHMDIRPDNIVMKTTEKNGTYPVLIDFGISLYFDFKDKSGTTLMIKGASPGYAPPEQIAKKCEFSPQYDIYALGAVLFYLCTGETPPNGNDIISAQDQLRQMLDGKVSINVETAILNAMKPNAEERTPSIQRFRDDIKGIVFLPRLEVSEKQLDFSKGKSQKSVKVDSNIDWTAWANEDWCHLSKTKDSVTISVSKNNESSARTCNVIINGRGGNISHLIHVNQSGVGTMVFRNNEESERVRNSKNVYICTSLLVIVGCILGVIIWLKMPLKLETKKIASVDQSQLVAEEAPNLAFDIEEEVAFPSDSISEVEKVTPQPVRDDKQEETNDVKFARARRNNDVALMLSLSKDNYVKAYYPLAEMYLDKNDMDNAKQWAQKAINANVYRSEAIALLKRITSVPQEHSSPEIVSVSSPSMNSSTKDKETQLQEALKDPSKGIATLVRLALNERYAPSYFPYAKQLLKGGNTNEAKKYLRLSIESGTNVSQAKQLLELLEE